MVDGSPGPVWRAHHDAFGDRVAHLRPDPGLTFGNGKVNGVLTGLAAASHEAVVLADDDVRYDPAALRRLAALLEAADLVRPQNYFAPLPWHARLDTARTLLNRVAGGDFPGTLGVRRSLVLGAGGYDGDVLFENLELLRTVRAAGGTVLTPLDLYVRRLPREPATSSASGSARPTTSWPARPGWPSPWPCSRPRPCWPPGAAGSRWLSRPDWPWPPPRPVAAGPVDGPCSRPRAACWRRSGCWSAAPARGWPCTLACSGAAPPTPAGGCAGRPPRSGSCGPACPARP